MPTENEGRVAVYIDFDNIVISRYNQLHGRGAFQSDRVRDVDASSGGIDAGLAQRLGAATVDIGAVLDYASSFGQIVVSRAYADWSQPVNAGYRRQLVDRAIDLTQMFPLSATKNGADIRLAIDVVEDLFRLGDVTHVVLVAGDSDYVALAQRVKRLGRTIVAVGVAGATSRALPAACNDFSLYDDLPGFSSDDDDDADASATPESEAESDGETTTASKSSGGGKSSRGKRAAGGKAAAQADDRASSEESTDGTADAASDAPSTDEPTPPARTRTSGRRVSSSAPDATPGNGDDGDDEAQAAKMTPRAATTLLRRALELGHDKHDDEWLHTSAVKQQIKRLDPSFHEKSLGYTSFTDFVKSRSRIAELDKASNGQRVRLRIRRVTVA